MINLLFSSQRNWNLHRWYTVASRSLDIMTDHLGSLKKKYYFHNRLTNALVYYGLMLTSTQLAGDRYLNFFINVGVELPAVISFVFLVKRYIHNTISFKIFCLSKLNILLPI
jgi:hypothetical protein